MATADPAGAPSTGGGLDLVDTACRESLRKLTKEGGVSEYTSQIAAALGFTIGAIVAVVYIRLDVYNSTTISTGMRGWARLAYWVLLFSIPFCLLFAGWAFAMSKRVAGSANLMLKCPGCGTTHEISNVHRKSFRLTCPRCYTVFAGSAASYATARHCDYCGLDYFGPPTGDCPGCRGDDGRFTCPKCKETVARGSLACVQCDHWLAPKETGLEYQSYDPTTFGHRLARTYVMALWQRVAPQVEMLANLLKAEPDPKNFSPGVAGQLGFNLGEPAKTLPKLALAVQWMRRPGSQATPLPGEIAAGLASLDESVTRCVNGGMKHLQDVQVAVRTARRVVAG